MRRAGSGCRTNDDESAAAARQFNATVLSGRLRKAVRGLTNRDGGGVLQPDDVCTKTGRRVLEVRPVRTTRRVHSQTTVDWISIVKL